MQLTFVRSGYVIMSRGSTKENLAGSNEYSLNDSNETEDSERGEDEEGIDDDKDINEDEDNKGENETEGKDDANEIEEKNEEGIDEEKDINVDEDNEDEEDANEIGDEEKIDQISPEENVDVHKSFKELGIVDVLCEACEKLKWSTPTKIQKEAIPLALAGRDVIGLAETGSGKTAAFALPILQALLEHPQRYFALILTPTRELAFQISEQFEALGAGIGVKSAVIVGGMDMMSQEMMLAKKPHILIATPGRLVDHLENTKGFNLKSLKYLVMDEADRILNMDFEIEVDKILRVIPRERHTFLFSATMTKKVQKLQRASLKNPVKVEVSTKYKTVEKLQQYYIFIPMRYKDVYLVYLMNEMAGNSFMIFCATCNGTMKTALMLRNLGMSAIPLNGQMSQNKRLAALTKFRAKSRSALISTDVASRGLDIPHVDIVINLDIPTHSKDYIHRVGRTARAGRSGIAVTFVTQYDVELYQRIEHLIGKKLPKYETKDEEVMMLEERVGESKRTAVKQLKDLEDIKGRKRKRTEVDNGLDDDTETSLGIRKRMFGKNKNNKFKKKFGKRKK